MTTYLSTEQFRAFLTAWKDLANRKLAAAEDMLLHALICHGDTRGFTPVTNPGKLMSGADPSRALTDAAFSLSKSLRRLEKSHPGAEHARAPAAAAAFSPEQSARLQEDLRLIRCGEFKVASTAGDRHA